MMLNLHELQDFLRRNGYSIVNHIDEMSNGDDLALVHRGDHALGPDVEFMPNSRIEWVNGKIFATSRAHSAKRIASYSIRLVNGEPFLLSVMPWSLNQMRLPKDFVNVARIDRKLADGIVYRRNVKYNDHLTRAVEKFLLSKDMPFRR
ncbi:hypothetical protein J4475_00065 [Candidatus Woesearchaeota archaeon]|nr:hypothetical protein [Candidatus Woesearchaeota archaeon]